MLIINNNKTNWVKFKTECLYYIIDTPFSKEYIKKKLVPLEFEEEFIHMGKASADNICEPDNTISVCVPFRFQIRTQYIRQYIS